MKMVVDLYLCGIPVAMPVTGSTPNAAPIAIPSVKLCRPSPITTIKATGVNAGRILLFVSLTIIFSSLFFFDDSKSLSKSSQLPQLFDRSMCSVD